MLKHASDHPGRTTETDLRLLDRFVLAEVHRAAQHLGRPPTETDLLEGLLPADPLCVTEALTRLVNLGRVQTRGDGPGYLAVGPVPEVTLADIRGQYADVGRHLVAQLDRVLGLLNETRRLWSHDPPLAASTTLDPTHLLESLEHQFLPELYVAATHWRDAVDEAEGPSFTGQEALDDTRRAITICQDLEHETLAGPDD